MQFIAQGPEEICLSLEHQNPSITSGSPFGRKKKNKEREGKGGGGGELFAQDRLTRYSVPLSPSGDVPYPSEDMACGY